MFINHSCLQQLVACMHASKRRNESLIEKRDPSADFNFLQISLPKSVSPFSQIIREMRSMQKAGAAKLEMNVLWEPFPAVLKWPINLLQYS